MEDVRLHWAKGVMEFREVEKSESVDLDYIGFYAILGAKRDNLQHKFVDVTLLYIGQAYEQTLRERIPQPHAAYKCISSWLQSHPGYEAVVMIGLRAPSGNTSQALYDDIECCLIFDNQPHCNDTCKGNYHDSGREIKIINMGDYAPLKECSVCRCT